LLDFGPVCNRFATWGGLLESLHAVVQPSLRGVEVHYIQPGKPDQNAYIERFNRSYRTEVLNAHLFESIAELRALADTWLRIYNRERPYDSLGRVPPLMFLPRPSAAGESLFAVSTSRGSLRVVMPHGQQFTESVHGWKPTLKPSTSNLFGTPAFKSNASVSEPSTAIKTVVPLMLTDALGGGFNT
jgi:integrase-like protein